jgi:hypothetical protein
MILTSSEVRNACAAPIVLYILAIGWCRCSLASPPWARIARCDSARARCQCHVCQISYKGNIPPQRHSLYHIDMCFHPVRQEFRLSNKLLNDSALFSWPRRPGLITQQLLRVY